MYVRTFIYMPCFNLLHMKKGYFSCFRTVYFLSFLYVCKHNPNVLKSKMSKMYKLIMIMVCCLASLSQVRSQTVAVKSNLLSDATLTPHVGVELALHKQVSVDVSGEFNGWTINKKSWKHWDVQPEVRYWLFECFNGHYLGLNGLYMDYDMQGVVWPLGMKKDYAYDGKAYGVGLSYGYQLYLTPRWNLDISAGVGYTYLKYDKYNFADHLYLGKYKNNYFGLCKASIAIVYIIK